MRIVADENIPLVNAFFDDIGTVTQVDGRTMSARDVKDADILLVRSVTQVTQALLEGSSVKCVATATIGIDHIDTDYLSANNIAFMSAPGCNAQAVVDYVLSSLSVLVDSRGVQFNELSVGLVGVGHVGGLLRQRLQKMGVTVLAYDPFVDSATDAFEAVLTADVVSLHTPLTTDGEYPTQGMIGQAQLAQMKPDACLINTCRGNVVDGSALLAHMKAHDQFEAVLDVWENEPVVDIKLMRRAMIATPHIAGYSLDGKMRGTEMVYRAVCEFLGLPIRYKLAQFLPESPIKRLGFSDRIPTHQALRTAIRASYEVRVDDGVMRSAMSRLGNDQATFDGLRRDYPLRRDLLNLRVDVPAKCGELKHALEAVGFVVKSK